MKMSQKRISDEIEMNGNSHTRRMESTGSLKVEKACVKSKGS